MKGCGGAAALLVTLCSKLMTAAAIAQLGERQTEDLKVPGSIPGLGIVFFSACAAWILLQEPQLHFLSGSLHVAQLWRKHVQPS